MSTLSLFLAFAASACGSQFESETPPLPTGTVPVKLQEVARGLAFPLYLTSPPDDPRLFVVEKGGAIRIIKGGTLLPLPFLDLAGQVSTGSEQGLLGLAFDPAYETTGRFIVHYTDVAGDTRVSAFHVSTDPDRADPTSESVILTADQPFANHNGGQILFGPDGLSLPRPGRWRLRRRSQRHRPGAGRPARLHSSDLRWPAPPATRSRPTIRSSA